MGFGNKLRVHLSFSFFIISCFHSLYMIWCRFHVFMAIKYSYGQERLNSTFFLFSILLTTALHLVLSPHTHKFYWTIQWIGSLILTPAHPDIFGRFINQRGWFSYLSLCYGRCQINNAEALLFRKHVEGNVAFKIFPVLNKNCCKNLHTSRNEILNLSALVVIR